jgi:hypothetical protein
MAALINSLNGKHYFQLAYLHGKYQSLIALNCRSRSDFGDYPVPVLVAYHLMTSYYFYCLSITYYPMSIKWQ